MTTIRGNGQSSRGQQQPPILSPDTRYAHEFVSMSDPLMNHRPYSNSERSREDSTAATAEDPTGKSSVPADDQRMPVWNPFILRQTCLVGVMAMHIAVLSAVVTLYRYSERNNGFFDRFSSDYYAFKYGPMAIIVLIAGLWHQVDYHCRLLAPWQSLSQGPRSAPETIQLEYISPLDAVACVRALQYRHWAVAASVAGMIVLDIALVFSTGLLVRIPVVQHGVNEVFLVDSEFSIGQFVSDDSAPGMIVWGTFDEGLSLPFGTTSDLAFTTPMLNNRERVSEVVTVNVQAFVPHISCDPATVNVNVSQSETNSGQVFIQATVSTPTCDLFSTPLEISMLQDKMPPRVLTGSAGMTLCSESGLDDDYQPWSFVVLDMRYHQTLGSSFNETLNVTYWSAHFNNTTAVVCQPSYEIQDVAVSIEVSTRSILAVNSSNARSSDTSVQLNGFSNHNFSLGMSLGLSPLYKQFKPQWSALSLTRQDSDDAIFALMSRLNDTYNLETLLNADVLTNAIRVVFNKVAAQMAHRGLSTATNSSTTGTAQYIEHRIFVKLLPTVVLCVTFGILALLSVCILWYQVRDLTPQAPQSILGLAAILGASTKLRRQLQGTGRYSDEDLTHCLYGRQYVSFTNQTARFSIEPFQSYESASAVDHSVEKWYRPFSSRAIFIGLTVTCSVGVFVGLEIIRSLSTPMSGFLTLQISRSSATFWATTVPTAVMVMIKLLFQGLNFAVLVFSPFVPLTKSTPRAGHMSLRNVTGQLPFLNIWQSVRSCQPLILLISAAVMLSSFLTIIVSGLYSVHEFDTRTDINVKTLDYFDLVWNTTDADDIAFDNQAGNIFALIDWYNLSYPVLTYDELAFPRIDLSEGSISITKNDTRLRISVPATRASLNCSFAVPGQATAVWNPHAPGSHTHDTIMIGNQVQVPEICSMRTGYEVLNITTTRAAQIFLEQGQYFSLPNQYPWMHNKSDYPGICPNFGFTFGFTGRYSNSTKNITTLTCYQMVEEVDTVTTFLWPSLSIDRESPPVVNESAARVIMPHAAYELDAIIKNGFGSLQIAPLEPFFLHVINGSEGIPMEQLLGPENHMNLMAGVQHVYRKYMAQAISLNMRKPVTASRPSPAQRDIDTSTRSYRATFLDPHGLCIVQNKWPRIVLEATLGTMLVFALIAFLGTPMKKVLPHNPLTIAGTMSLLAGGLLSRDRAEGGIMPEGAGRLSEARLRQIVKGYGFHNLRIGWWQNDGTLLADTMKGRRRSKINDHRDSISDVSSSRRKASEGYFGISLLRKATTNVDVNCRPEDETELASMLTDDTS